MPVDAHPGPARSVWVFGGVAIVTIVSLFWFSKAHQEDAPRVGTATVEQLSPAPSDTRGLDVTAMPSTAKAAERAVQLIQGVQASHTAWPTEAFSEHATAQLKKLAKLLPTIAATDSELRSLVADDFQTSDLRPDNLTRQSVSPHVEIRRMRAPAAGPVESNLRSSLSQLFQGVVSEARAAFKIVRVRPSDTGYATVVHAEGGGITDQGRVQWTALWDCNWSADAVLRSIVVTDYEEVMSSNSQQPWLVDATEAVLGGSDSFHEQMLYGTDYWVNKLEHRFHVNRLGHHGLAIGDANNDGLEDLYVCQPGGLPNRLYVHQPDGTAVDNSRLSGLDILDDTTAALFVDLDNDGDQDLALLAVSGGFIFANDGQGRFSLRTTMPECRNAFSITAADYDRDGLLDLYVGHYWPDEKARGAIPLPVPYYDALNGGANVLLRNKGEWRFEDVTREVGLGVDNTRYTMAASWEDYDNDGDQDLYVANDFGRNCLYRNDDGHFTNVAQQAGVEDTAAGMSVSWADYNHDGRLDVYVGNMFSSAGGRITYQRQFQERFDESARAKLQRLARGNSLFRNEDGKRFVDVSVSSGVAMGRWAWGSVFADLNNDSWDDLVVANGHITTEDTGDL